MLDRLRAAALCAATLLAGLAAADPARAATRPNILLILADDQTISLAERMPNLRRLVAGKGATLTRAYYNDPLCAPSRSTILTGRYFRNTRVDENNYAAFHAAGN